ncbi:MAG: hypothetical protein LAP85_11265 [Acidobacteriia bacterium]|nr:hypothetical protein [Terriglobia bacterium]
MNGVLIVAVRSRLVLEKGKTISATMDLLRHAWGDGGSSLWPENEFDAVVPKGKYILRLEIPGAGELIRSNEIEVIIETQ